MTQTIFMVGARGAGKTTVGNALALALGYQFIDTDLLQRVEHYGGWGIQGHQPSPTIA